MFKIKIEDSVREIRNQGPTPVYVGREVGDKIEVLFTLKPGETGELREQRLVAESRDGSGVVRLLESRS